jgi:50S ribosomal subunit-associated GTPase HflX
MARALLGHVGSPGEQALAYEVARLRRRVDDLEAEVTRLRETRGRELDLELHRFAEVVEPALA